MKILIAIPTFETIYPDTYKSVWDLDKCGHDVSFEFVRGYDCATARNMIASIALDGQYDYVLYIDNDTTLPKDALLNLLSDDADVVFGYYAKRNTDCKSEPYNGNTCAFKLTGEVNYSTLFTDKELAEFCDNGDYKVIVHGSGFGCALIKVDVFRRLPYPWFRWICYENKSMLSEDLFFCETCKNFGIPLYVDTRVKCGHLFRYVQNVI